MERLSETHGCGKAARVFTQLLSVVVAQGEEPVRQALETALSAGSCDLLVLRERLYPWKAARISVPEPLRQFEVASAQVRDYDWMLKRAEK